MLWLPTCGEIHLKFVCLTVLLWCGFQWAVVDEKQVRCCGWWSLLKVIVLATLNN